MDIFDLVQLLPTDDILNTNFLDSNNRNRLLAQIFRRIFFSLIELSHSRRIFFIFVGNSK